MRACLIAIDLQSAFLDDQRLEPGAGRILEGASAWLERFRVRGLPIIHVRTTVGPDGEGALPHWQEHDWAQFVPGAAGWEFASKAAPHEGEPIVEKTHYSGFQSGELLDLLRQREIDELVMVGVHLHGCVRSTALDASAAGMEVIIGLDATASNDAPHAAATRRWMSARGFRFAGIGEWDGSEPPRAATDHERTARAAATRASDAFDGWRELSPDRRAALLQPLGDALRDEADRLAQAMAAGIHKPLREAQEEVSYAAELADQALEGAAAPVLRTPDGLARRVPHGPVLMITPWNNPIGIPVGKIVPALVHGNTVVWAPSPLASSVSAALEEIVQSLGLPPGVLQRVEGGPDKVAPLVGSGAIRAVSLSGSLEAGRALHDLCAQQLIPLQAELGGNNAALVCDDVDIEKVADALVAGAFGFAGQRCTATRRAIVLQDVYDPLVEAVKDRVENLRAGDPSSPETTFAPVISADAAARLEALIERAQASGVKVWRPEWAGQQTHGEQGALAFVPPALIENPNPHSEVAREESFGPVLVLIRAASLADAIERCNDVPQGLVASIHTQSQEAVDQFARTTKAGILKANQPTAGAGASLPFGGFGLSGVGPPEHGEGDVEFHTRWQAIYGHPFPAGPPQ